MKFERLNDKQIKVTMTEQELIDRNITVIKAFYNSAELSELFADVKLHAKQAYDFDCDEDLILIKAIPVSETELVFILSKYSFLSDLVKNFNYQMSRRPETRIEAETENATVFSFKALDDVAAAAKRLRDVNIGYDGENALYKYKREYYLVMKGAARSNLGALADYGRKCPPARTMGPYLAEHGELVASQAVQKFAEYL